MSQLAEQAVAALELRPSTRREWERLVRTDIGTGLISAVPADRLTRAAIREWGARIVARGSPTTALHAFETLRRCYSWGLGRELVNSTPFVGLEPPAQRRKSGRVLSTDELRAVWRALAAMDQLAEYDGRSERAYIDATRLLILTAVRREMVVGMRAEELELGDEPRWIVPAARMKSGRDHVVPLSPQVLAMLKRLPSEGYMFPATRGAEGPMTWSSRFARDLLALARLIHPMPPFTIHGLRHTAATHMVEDLGVSSEVVSLILSHTPPGPAVTRVYQRAQLLAERRDALTRWAAWVEAL